MTCIAFRDGIIAADTMSVADGDVKRFEDTKIAKRKGHLFGIAGEAVPPIEEAIKWYFSKERKTLRGYEFDLLVIKPDHSIHQYDHKGREDNIQGTFYAIGSGGSCALGAMECGATAEQAVQAAIKWSTYVGGKVVVRKL